MSRSDDISYTVFSQSDFHNVQQVLFSRVAVCGPSLGLPDPSELNMGSLTAERRNTLCVNDFPPYFWMIMCTIHTLATFMPSTRRLQASLLSSAAFDGEVTIITCVFVPLGESPKSIVALIESVLLSHCDILCNLSIGRSDKHSTQLLSAINSGYFNHLLRALFCTVGAKRGQTILNCNWVMRQ
jgi:hypothetical protein